MLKVISSGESLKIHIVVFEAVLFPTMEPEMSVWAEIYWRLLDQHAYTVWRVYDKWENKALGELTVI